MKVAVLAANGSTGSLVVDKLLADGHEVVAVARSPVPRRDAASRFSVKAGELTDAAFLKDAMDGCDAVISCVGQSRASKSLFAKRTSPPDILRRVAAATLTAIGDCPQHYVYLSAFGVGEDRKRHALFFRIILRLSSLNDAYLDHAEAEAAINRSPVRWTIARAPGLTDKDEEVPLVDTHDRWSSFETASRRSVAAYLVRCVETGASLRRTVTIGEQSRR